MQIFNDFHGVEADGDDAEEEIEDVFGIVVWFVLLFFPILKLLFKHHLGTGCLRNRN